MKLLTHQDGYLRDKLGRWYELPVERRYKFAQDGTYAYEENEVEIKKFIITEKTRRSRTISETYILTSDRSRECVPTGTPNGRKLEITENALILPPRTKQITEKEKSNESLVLNQEHPNRR